MWGSSKNWNCQAVKKKQYFSLQWTRKQYQKHWKTQWNKSHWNAKHTSKTIKQHHNHGPQNWNQPFLPQFYTTFRTTHEHIFYITVFGYFIRIPFLSKFRATLFRIRFCTKCKACVLCIDSIWSRQISANNLTLVFHFNNFPHNSWTLILYHHVWYFIPIPYLSKFWATLFGILRFCTKCKACFLHIDNAWGRQIWHWHTYEQNCFLWNRSGYIQTKI